MNHDENAGGDYDDYNMEEATETGTCSACGGYGMVEGEGRRFRP